MKKIAYILITCIVFAFLACDNGTSPAATYEPDNPLVGTWVSLTNV